MHPLSLAGASLDPVATDSPKGASGGSAQHLHITSESQWRTFANSLASEGLVIELSEQQQLQKLWDRAVVGANSFGRKCVPLLGILMAYVDLLGFTPGCCCFRRRKMYSRYAGLLFLDRLLETGLRGVLT